MTCSTVGLAKGGTRLRLTVAAAPDLYLDQRFHRQWVR